MQPKLFILAFLAYLQCAIVAGQRVWVSPSTTAQEMRNPATWYRPYYQAAGEAYSKYLQNAREISQQLQQQAYLTGAWGRPNGQGGQGGQVGPQNPGGNVPNQNWG